MGSLLQTADIVGVGKRVNAVIEEWVWNFSEGLFQRFNISCIIP